jgi:hypothetical protein
MILLWAVIIGFTAGLARAIVGKRRFRAPNLHKFWILIVAFIPQFFAFRLPYTRSLLPDRTIPFFLVGSQLLLIIFAAINLSVPGFWVLGLGLMLNFLVIVLNHGMMPISPETVNKLLPPGAPPVLWVIGERYGVSKDIVLSKGDTWLWFLSDMFVLPIQNNYRVAFSLGDLLMALGAIWLLWSLGGPEKMVKRSQEDNKE